MEKNLLHLLLALCLFCSCSIQKEILDDYANEKINTNKHFVAESTQSDVAIVVIEDGKKRGKGSNATCYGTKPFMGCWRWLPSDKSLTVYDPWAIMDFDANTNLLNLTIKHYDPHGNYNGLYSRLASEHYYNLEEKVLLTDSVLLQNEHLLLGRVINSGSYSLSVDGDNIETKLDYYDISYDFLFQSYIETLNYLDSLDHLNLINSYSDIYSAWYTRMIDIMSAIDDDDVMPLGTIDSLMMSFDYMLANSTFDQALSMLAQQIITAGVNNTILTDIKEQTAFSLFDIETIIRNHTLSINFDDSHTASALQYFEQDATHNISNTSALNTFIPISSICYFMSHLFDNKDLYGGVCAAFGTYLCEKRLLTH